jgi:L-amino acid N-acyltransferase
MKLVPCEFERHGQAILAIFNDAIEHSTVLYDYKPRTLDMMAGWFEAKRKGAFPIIGVESDSGEFMGFASYGTFRAWAAYKYSVEHSVYVDLRFRGRGLGKMLMKEIIAAAQGQNYHTLIGVIDSSNAVSIHLHEGMGFASCGHIRQAGFKFGRWLDVLFYQLILSTPSQPSEG